jgi:DNA-binding CsgD family transcriptional regulator
MDFELYDELVDAIYDAAMVPAQWPAVLKKLNAAFNSNLAGFFVQTSDNHFGESLFDGFAPEMAKTYAEHYSTVNPWFTTPDLARPGRILTDHTLEALTGNRRAYIDTEYYQDWARLADMRHGIGGTLHELGGGLLNFTLFRAETAGYYTEQEIQFYVRLSHHLMKATRIGNQVSLLTAEKDDRNTALDQLRLGIIVLDASARIVHMNKYAKTLIESGVILYERKALISAKPEKNAAALKSALDEVALRSRIATINLLRDGQSPLSVCIVPNTEQRLFLDTPHKSITLFISDPDDRDFSGAEILAKRWQLTELESNFALRLAKGQTTKQIAVELQLTRYTAQWYCKQIMHKVGVKRQAELCIKLVTDIALLVGM